MKRSKRIRMMRRAHVRAAKEQRADTDAIKRGLVERVTGFQQKAVTPVANYFPKKPKIKTIKTWRHRDPSFIERCKHKAWRKVNKDWKQCKRCKWCKPRKGEVDRRLPAFLKHVVLPPLHLAEQNHKSYRYAGIIMLNKRVRLKLIQYTFTEATFIDRYAVEVRFKKYGWVTAGIVPETAWSKIARILKPKLMRKPRRFWTSVQFALYERVAWLEPWMVSLGRGQKRKRIGTESQYPNR